MNYVSFTVGDKEYKLRLSTRAVIDLEKKLGCNPLSIFGNGDTIPTITAMIAILHASITQYQHNISLTDTYNIFDEYLMEHSMTDFIPVILDIYKASGLIKQEEETEKN